MKSKKRHSLLIRTVIFIITLILLLCIMAIGLFYYVFSIPEPEGISTTKFPRDFTNSFSVWVTYGNGELTVEEIGLERLDEYGLWVQFLDENGEEIFSHNKPENYPAKYTAADLLALSTSEYADGYTLFVNSLDGGDEECSYIVGFPYDIGKHMLLYNGSRISRLSPAAKFLIAVGFCVLAASVFAYSVWLSRKLSKVTDGICRLTARDYTQIKEKGMFSGIYASLNEMDRELRQADQVQKETERTRQEWITNITHDLKTPLSPIKGYAELLGDGSVKEEQEIQKYGGIILKNVDHTEKLIDDLKLTYQLESGSIPYRPRNMRIALCIKEWVIDIINDPASEDRDISFESAAPDIAACIDPELFRRAVKNLITNALIHNPADTKIKVEVSAAPENCARISVRDNGAGISEKDQAKLFDRYYRGTNTKEKPEGSGLGLAIAKQIITLHGGSIMVKSKMNAGTEFIILLPARN